MIKQVSAIDRRFCLKLTTPCRVIKLVALAEFNLLRAGTTLRASLPCLAFKANNEFDVGELSSPSIEFALKEFRTVSEAAKLWCVKEFPKLYEEFESTKFKFRLLG